MKPLEEEAIRKLVGEWIRKADQGIASAQALLLQDPPLLYPSCFHSKQAAEKYLKAYLTWRQVEFPKTHSIRELLNLVQTVDEESATSLLPAAVLTPYDADVRYPSDIPDPTKRETGKALSLAKKVCGAVSRRLKETRPAE
jgi:HEPN domain-containing protein